MPKTKNTPTKEPDEDPAAEIAALKAQLQRRDQEVAALERALRPSDGIISTPAPVIGPNNPWNKPQPLRNTTNLPQPLSVASQAAPTGPARVLDLEEKADTLRHVKEALEQKANGGTV